MYVYGTTAKRAQAIRQMKALTSRRADIHAVPLSGEGRMLAERQAMDQCRATADEGGPALVYFTTDQKPARKSWLAEAEEYILSWATKRLPIRVMRIDHLEAEC